jgi:uncharacterized protein YkwD
LLAAHNAIRAELSLPAYTWNGTLEATAYNHCVWMSNNNTLSHTGVDGTQPFDRAVREGYYCGTMAVGENCAVGQVTIEQVMREWRNSPTHYPNIVHEDFTEMGGAVVTTGARFYWCVVFGYCKGES